MKKITGKINLRHFTKSMLLVLSGLLMISSCNIRKSVQASLEIPVTRQLNPSKATTGSSTVCLITETDRHVLSSAFHTATATAFLTGRSEAYNRPELQFTFSGYYKFNGWPLSEKVDHFILFCKMKTWL